MHHTNPANLFVGPYSQPHAIIYAPHSRSFLVSNTVHHFQDCAWRHCLQNCAGCRRSLSYVQRFTCMKLIDHKLPLRLDQALQVCLLVLVLVAMDQHPAENLAIWPSRWFARSVIETSRCEEVTNDFLSRIIARRGLRSNLEPVTLGCGHLAQHMKLRPDGVLQFLRFEFQHGLCARVNSRSGCGVERQYTLDLVAFCHARRNMYLDFDRFAVSACRLYQP